MLKGTAFARENKNVPGAFYRGKGFAAGHVDDLENRGMFANTELVDKFAALFADAERTEVHGTEYLQDLFWEHGSDIHGRCAHGCVTEGTERGWRRAGHVDDLKNRGMFADTELALLGFVI